MVDAQTPDEKQAVIRQKRDAKARDHLAQYAPVWLVDEDFVLDEDSMRFEVVFFHPRYQWLRRRYYFDAYNNVLHHKGQVRLDEGDTYDIQAQAPYISADVLNTVDSYGG
ncbi:MAG: hypothetical protein ACLFTK_02515 [Anaerolineales bacterium]